MKTKILFCIYLLLITGISNAQVKIGNNPSTINSNSLLELESTAKGFLPQRVALNDVSAVTPLTGTVPEGFLHYDREYSSPKYHNPPVLYI